jgi:hypothetical protein
MPEQLDNQLVEKGKNEKYKKVLSTGLINPEWIGKEDSDEVDITYRLVIDENGIPKIHEITYDPNEIDPEINYPYEERSYKHKLLNIDPNKAREIISELLGQLFEKKDSYEIETYNKERDILHQFEDLLDKQQT